MSKIDKKDLEIINLLMENGRMACSEIATRTEGLTERAVRYRMNRLIADNIIQICAIPSSNKLGYPVVADIFIEAELPHIQKIAHALSEYECVGYVGCSIGSPDISIQIFAPDNETVYRFTTEVIARIDGVIKTKTTILSIVVKDNQDWRIPLSKSKEFRKLNLNNKQDK